MLLISPDASCLFWVFLTSIRIIKSLLLPASTGVSSSSSFSYLVSSLMWAGNLRNSQSRDLFDLMILQNALYIQW